VYAKLHLGRGLERRETGSGPRPGMGRCVRDVSVPPKVRVLIRPLLRYDATDNCREGLDGMCSANRVDAWLRKPEVLYFAGSDQIRNCAGDLFDRNRRIDAVLVKEVDRIDA
jgi:hypothetical protein